MSFNRVAERFLEPKQATRTLNVLLAPHSYDGSSYYRIWSPLGQLNTRSSHRIGGYRPGGPIIKPSDVEMAEVDVLVFQRPAGREGTQMLERLAGQVKLVYEVDDNMFDVEASGLTHLAADESDDMEIFKESVRRCVRLCDMVTVTNKHLAEVYRPFNDNIRILPNFIHAGLLEMQRPKRERLTIGWGGGTSHLVDMVTVAEPLRDVLAANPNVDMHWMGFDYSPLVRRACRWTKWKPDIDEYYRRIDFDIAIAPIADVKFNRGKTWIRALEMAALGIPVVAHNRLPYSDFVLDGKTGFLVNSENEWRERLTELINDVDLRSEMGAAAKVLASEWTIEEGWRLWESAYESVAFGDA